jgi:hypothetical protein
VVEKVVSLATAAHGPIPSLRDAAWWTAPIDVKVASLLMLSEAYLVNNPETAAVEMLREMAYDIAGALPARDNGWQMTWRDVANRHVTDSEVKRRRAEPGLLGGLVVDPAAEARWVATGTSEEHAA